MNGFMRTDNNDDVPKIFLFHSCRRMSAKVHITQSRNCIFLESECNAEKDAIYGVIKLRHSLLFPVKKSYMTQAWRKLPVTRPREDIILNRKKRHRYLRYHRPPSGKGSHMTHSYTAIDNPHRDEHFDNPQPAKHLISLPESELKLAKNISRSCSIINVDVEKNLGAGTRVMVWVIL